MTRLFDMPKEVRPHPAGLGGVQRRYEFTNGWAASVVRFPGSYGSKDGLWELAVLESFNGPISYDTDITDDVLGYLTEDDVEETLHRISALEAS